MGFTYDNDNGYYYNRTKLSNGQYCQIGFQTEGRYRDLKFYVIFAVANKKKNLIGYFNETKGGNALTLHMTGKCGVEALFWAKHQLQEFEAWINEYAHHNYNIAIVVNGEDGRRFNCYKRYLVKHGYRLCIDSLEGKDIEMGLIKRIRPNKKRDSA